MKKASSTISKTQTRSSLYQFKLCSLTVVLYSYGGHTSPEKELSHTRKNNNKENKSSKENFCAKEANHSSLFLDEIELILVTGKVNRKNQPKKMRRSTGMQSNKTNCFVKSMWIGKVVILRACCVFVLFPCCLATETFSFFFFSTGVCSQ